jgi:hypothetical protein
MKTAAALLLAAALAGCTGDTGRARREARFQDLPSDVTCRSFGEVVYQGRSTGRVRIRRGVVSFVDAANGRLVTTTAECVIVSAGRRPG